MTDTKAPQAEGQGNAPAPATLPAELTLKRHGKEQTVPLEKARDLAQKGYDYEMRTQELKAREDALKSDEKGFREFKNLQAHLAGDKTTAEAVAFALQNPSIVRDMMNGKPSSKADDLDDDVPASKVPDQRVQSLERELSEVKGQLSAREIKERAAELKVQIEGEIDSYPWLKGKRKALAYRQAAAALRDSSDSITSVVGVIAQEMKEAWEEEKSAELAQQQERQGLRTESPRRGSPLGTPPTKMDAKSFGNGALTKAVKDAARNFGLNL